ncbi:macrolide family glycosyltransferase [Micromonospora sp. DT233]|uniref:macrolide family glycosyltransferase n=1 Tax=Micromonospora sp. DT233 TaxID=3393432 RepID=UPI003CF62277
MSHAAIFMFPGYGHVNPTLELSRHLVAAGHRVTYVVEQRHTAAVTAVGAQVVDYVWRRDATGQGAVSGEDIGALGLAFLRESADVILPRALAAFGTDVPDLVLYDLESFFAARSAARRWGRPTGQLFPYVASNEHFSLALEVFGGAGEHVYECIKLVVVRLVAEGREPAEALPLLTNFDRRNLALLPRAFQPRGETFDDRYTFTGHSFATDQPGTGSWAGPAGAGPVALITLGTEVNDRPEFFRTCGTAFADGRWHVVMTVGPGNLPATGVGSPHLEVHEWLPFRAVLPHASVLVCHGGMGSVLEALFFGRPLVIVPHTPEQTLNAARVAELGLGLMVEQAEFDAERLRAAVEQVVADPRFGQRVARMREAMLAGGGPARAAEVVEGWLRERPDADWAHSGHRIEGVH